jgi:hypothetical protein
MDIPNSTPDVNSPTILGMDTPLAIIVFTVLGLLVLAVMSIIAIVLYRRRNKPYKPYLPYNVRSGAASTRNLVKRGSGGSVEVSIFDTRTSNVSRFSTINEKAWLHDTSAVASAVSLESNGILQDAVDAEDEGYVLDIGVLPNMSERTSVDDRI